jgi:CheY-like chemotaxis protein
MAASLDSFEVLIVDDEPADVRLLQMALRQGGYPCNISIAGNGAEALDLLRGNFKARRPAPDLILLDLNMPQMNGREFLQHVKSDQALRLAPVVVVSTSDAERDVVAAYELGASGYLSKPVDIDDLFSAIRRIEDYWFGAMRRPHWS